MRKWTRLGAAVAALALICTTNAAAQTPGDDYRGSLLLNDPDTGKLERQATLVDQRDTTNFTVQSDLFNPPGSGGPAEPTTCEGSSYGNTTWYDFRPDFDGLVRIRASGFDAVISIMRFNPRPPFMPDLAHVDCFNREPAGATEEAFEPVLKGRAYTVQVGGVNSTGGQLTFQFDFLSDIDGDGVLDASDDCRNLPGTTKSGCPRPLNADTLLRVQPTASGVKVLALSVTAPRQARVSVGCTRRACPSEVKRAHSTVRFRKIRGRSLPAGSKIVIRVTKPSSIGTYVAYRITRGNIKKVERCLNPGSRKPRKRCG